MIRSLALLAAALLGAQAQAYDLTKISSTGFVHLLTVPPTAQVTVKATPVLGIDADENLVVLHVNPDGSLALPAGAATAAKQDEQTALLQQIYDDVAKEAKQDTQITLATDTNTKLDTSNGHLAAIESFLDSIESNVDVPLSTRASEATLASVLGAVDGLEGLVTSTNAKLDTAQLSFNAISAATASIDSDFNVQLSTRASEVTAAGIRTDLTTTIHNDLTQVQANVGAPNESAAASDTATSGLNGLIKRLLQKLTAVTQLVSATVVDGDSALLTKSVLIGRTAGGTTVKVRVDGDGRLITTTDLENPETTFEASLKRVISAGAAYYQTNTITTDVAVKRFVAGGNAALTASLNRYVSTNTLTVPGGGFNSAPEVAQWTNTSIGSSNLLTWSYATDQAFSGTGSAKLTFTQSDNNNYPEITYTWSPATDLSGWKAINANSRVTVAAGGAKTRTISIRMTSGTAIRIWQLAGTTTTAPFSTEQWHTINGDLENPHATAGTGTFDINNVNSISLRLQDGGNKAGSIWWDNVRLEGSITQIEKIYSSTGNTIQLPFDPIVLFLNGETSLIIVKNNGASQAEFSAKMAGVDLQ